MEFEWDDAKSIRNQTLRGLSFSDAAMIFDGPIVETADDRRAYGETRFKALGRIKDETYVVIYTDRQGVRRSSRPAAPTGKNASYGTRS
jgi:uncharacterized DUF497 family protein